MAIAAALMLGVCACSTVDPPKPEIRTVLVTRPISAAARQSCDAPVALPERVLSAQEVTTFWGQDRSALHACETRRRAAIAGAP
jgi:hypothetical protein